MKPDFVQYGFRHHDNLIMAYIGGSQARGAKLGETDDTDWYGLKWTETQSAAYLVMFILSFGIRPKSVKIDRAESVLYT